MTSGAPARLSTSEVQAMFERVAARYDLANRIMTLGMDRRWRRSIQDRANLGRHERLLDLATGTGQLAFDARRRAPSADIVATDLTAQMLHLAQQRPEATRAPASDTGAPMGFARMTCVNVSTKVAPHVGRQMGALLWDGQISGDADGLPWFP